MMIITNLFFPAWQEDGRTMTSAGSALNRQATKTVKSWRSGGGWNSCFKLGNASTHLDPFPSSIIPILDNSRGWGLCSLFSLRDLAQFIPSIPSRKKKKKKQSLTPWSIPRDILPGDQKNHLRLPAEHFQDPTESTAERVIGYSVVRGKVAKGCRIHLRTPFLFPSCGGSCAADNWRGVRIPGSSSVGQRLGE